MSIWTHVRIMYDISKGAPEQCKEALEDLQYEKIGITQLLESVRQNISYKKGRTLFDLGSEGGVTMTFLPFYGYSSDFGNMLLEIDDRGTLIITGDLRDCEREEFIQKLNIYIKELRKYGIRIVDGMVKIY